MSRIRIWCRGCATGEEAYSIAICCLENRHEARGEAGDPGVRLRSRQRALAVAREGRFPASIEADVGEDRLRRFFWSKVITIGSAANCATSVLFAGHNMLKDPPFSRLDLDLLPQRAHLSRSRAAAAGLHDIQLCLKSERFLFLGASETAEDPSGAISQRRSQVAHLPVEWAIRREHSAASAPASGHRASQNLRRPEWPSTTPALC